MFDLDDLIERETRVYQTAGLPEPASLSSARRNVTEERLRTLETQANNIQQRLVAYQPASIWRRLWQPASDSGGAATLETQLDDVQRKILVARSNSASATQALKIEERKFHRACAQHETALSARQVWADARIATAQAARKFVEKNPNAAFWGAPYLMRVAADIQKARAEWHSSPDSVQNDWDLVPIFDLWGKPHLPPAFDCGFSKARPNPTGRSLRRYGNARFASGASAASGLAYFYSAPVAGFCSAVDIDGTPF